MKYVYLHGFASGPNSTKARFFARKFAEFGLSLEIPALDEGDFEHLTVTKQLSVIARACGAGPAVLIGSSLGGYLAAAYAARHPEIQCLVLMAPAFRFARRWQTWLGEAEMERWRQTGYRVFSHYGSGSERKLFYTLIEDGLQYEEFPAAPQPALVLHGAKDDVVPLGLSELFTQNEPRRRLVVVDSGHEMTDSVEQLWAETAAFLELAKV